MPAHANNYVPPAAVIPHTTARSRQQRVRLIVPGVCDLLLSPEEAVALADALVDIAESLTTETPSP
ncbi:hypothetical protein [Corynebacterium comes]|uniref:Uncharacterized protein n=1 Tax=Corynebacterium comes TaxID=2675218 RepID=A0A6B8VY60_9CORY|nr:hypothetical protein [Corynebacterium comes]QGU05101.1 hypothetical protein CETAM_09240 [Corynebacterium comes]